MAAFAVDELGERLATSGSDRVSPRASMTCPGQQIAALTELRKGVTRSQGLPCLRLVPSLGWRKINTRAAETGFVVLVGIRHCN